MMKPGQSPPHFHHSPASLNRFLVCGLSSLGQQCVVALKEFGVSIVAIEEVQPRS